ncbi:hypothetical protein HYFRA_00007287 [Hymenoscyphus fraxineus]|uniref:Uncharacterized protein n=1 Tax=Hymenoscyphus fraxineus TaxID=746836 RepID=A0A9N9KSK8_9HELO|nr:hypothetical protein HYFRA_00007287 [Hymenoscyphus fraxineus]
MYSHGNFRTALNPSYRSERCAQNLFVATGNSIGRSNLRVGVEGGVVYDSVVGAFLRGRGRGRAPIDFINQVESGSSLEFDWGAVMRRPLEPIFTATINAMQLGVFWGPRKWYSSRGLVLVVVGDRAVDLRIDYSAARARLSDERSVKHKQRAGCGSERRGSGSSGSTRSEWERAGEEPMGHRNPLLRYEYTSAPLGLDFPTPVPPASNFKGREAGGPTKPGQGPPDAVRGTRAAQGSHWIACDKLRSPVGRDKMRCRLMKRSCWLNGKCAWRCDAQNFSLPVRVDLSILSISLFEEKQQRISRQVALHGIPSWSELPGLQVPGATPASLKVSNGSRSQQVQAAFGNPSANLQPRHWLCITWD